MLDIQATTAAHITIQPGNAQAIAALEEVLADGVTTQEIEVVYAIGRSRDFSATIPAGAHVQANVEGCSDLYLVSPGSALHLAALRKVVAW